MRGVLSGATPPRGAVAVLDGTLESSFRWLSPNFRLVNDTRRHPDIAGQRSNAGPRRASDTSPTRRRDRSGRSSVTVKKKRSAETEQLIVGGCTLLSRW